MISYPSELPLPSQAYSLSIENSSIRSNMDSGRVRQRRRFTASKNEVTVKWQLTDEEFQLFESFTFHALEGGNSWFEVDLLTGSGIVPHKARFQDGKYKANYQAFFGWVVSATLDVDTINRLSQEALFEKVFDLDSPSYAQELQAAINSYYTENWYE